MRTLAIGDIHGCASELRTLLTELGWTLQYDGTTAVELTVGELEKYSDCRGWVDVCKGWR